MVKKYSIFTFLFLSFLAHGHSAYAMDWLSGVLGFPRSTRTYLPNQEVLGLTDLADSFFGNWPEFMKGNADGSVVSKIFESYEPFITKEKLERLFGEFNLRASNEKDKLAGKGASSIVRKVRVKADDEVYVIGDLHGSAHSLFRTFLRWKNMGILNDDFTLNKTESGGTRKVCFTGDYVDRGQYGIEVWCLLLRLKLANWNHCMKYGNDNNEAKSIFKTCILPAFELLPLALLVGNGQDFILVTHGMTPLDDEGKPVIDIYKKLIRESQECLRLSKADLSDKSEACSEGFPEEILSLEKENMIKKLEDYYCWGDVSKEGGPSERGMGIKNATIKTLDKAFKDSKIHAVFRGHQHGNSVIKVETMGSFLDGETIPVSYFPVYTLMSCPEGLGPDVSVEGWGSLTIGDKYKDWKLTCFEYQVAPRWRIKQKNALSSWYEGPLYTYVVRDEDDSFSWYAGGDPEEQVIIEDGYDYEYYEYDDDDAGWNICLDDEEDDGDDEEEVEEWDFDEDPKDLSTGDD